jgi:MFS family permease
MMRRVKSLEVLIMLLATAGLMASGQWLAWQVPLLLACTFLMGLHSTLFGPVKFAYLPQALRESELMGGNGMVEMGTFVAILLGNVAGGLLVAWPDDGPAYVAAACLALALAGRLAAQFIPEAPANDPALTINWNPWSETWRNLRHAKGDPKVFLALIGISWMWFFGAVFLSQFPAFAKEILHGNAQVASLLLVVFSVGIAIGSLLCEVLGRRQIELGLVPLGAIGMTLFTVDLYFASRALPPAALMDAAAFLQQAAHWRVMADLGLLSLSAGLYSVPLFALIQLRTAASHRARIIAANNILNALFMIASALLAGVLLTAGLDMAQVFLCVGLGNALVTLYLFVQEPDYGKRMKALLLRWTVRS